MATLWLPATQHCALQAAGIIEEQCTQHDGSAGCGADGHCATDACELLEDGGYRADVATLKIVAPEFAVCACLLCCFVSVAEPEETGIVVANFLERPRAWLPTWQFERRAAALAHAPDSLTV